MVSMSKDNTRSLAGTQFMVIVALMTALTTVATMAIKVPTPTFGYIHTGDGMVLLAGYILGPVYGSLAAGIGSALADLLSGYAVWVPGTFVIKALTALTASLLFKKLESAFGKDGKRSNLLSIISSSVGELVMVAGYFVYNIFILTVVNAGAEAVTVEAATISSFAEIPFNLIQGVFGVILALFLLPVARRLYKHEFR